MNVQIPSDDHAEKICLAAMLNFPGDLLVGRDLLLQSHFHNPRHRHIHRALVCLSLSRTEVDLVSVNRWLEDQGTSEAVGGIPFLASLDEVAPVRGSVKHYAQTLQELAKRRALIQAAYNMLNAAQSGAGSESAISAAEQSIAEIRADDTDELISASDAVDQLNASLQPENRKPAYATGVKGLDDKTQGGIRAGELWILGALPGRGKSSAARQISQNVVKSGVPTLIFSLEMTCTEWWGPDQANEAAIEPWRLREPEYLGAARKEEIEAAGERMRERPWWMDDSSHLHIDRLIAKARVAVLQKRIKLLVVDYVQRVEGTGDTMALRMGDVALKLAAFAKTNQVAVLLLSQLKRPNRINDRPSQEDLKESGYLSAHSHVVVLSFREVDEQSQGFTGEDLLIVDKNRHGPTGAVPVLFDGETLRFTWRAPTQIDPARPHPINVGRTGTRR